jgi:predicted transcriptional regulator
MTRHSTTLALSRKVRALAKERSEEQGFASINQYIDALIEEDRAAGLVKGWVRARIKEGLASPNAGRLTKKKLDRLIGQGIARAARRA